MVSTGTRTDKSLIYQAVSLINPKAIILIIIPSIIFIEDEEKERKKKNISGLVPITVVVKADLKI